MQYARTIFDELTLFNAALDHEDFIFQILGDLDDDYKDLCFAIHVHESPITFDELHEKLLNHETHLKYKVEKNYSKTLDNTYPTFKQPHNQHQPPSHYPQNLINQSDPLFYPN